MQVILFKKEINASEKEINASSMIFLNIVSFLILMDTIFSKNQLGLRITNIYENSIRKIVLEKINIEIFDSCK